MSAQSPLLDAEGPLRISVSCAGKLQQDLALISLSVRHALNALPWARLVLADGDMAKNESPLSDGELFKPGTAIQISCGYGEQEASIFSGIVVRHGLKISSGNDCRLVVECRDAACKMSLDRRSANYVDQSDADILQSLISNGGLQADVSSSAITHKEIVQYHCSDWDFMLARADALGWLVNVQAGKVKVAPPDTSAPPVLSLTWGQDLIELDADIDARRQWSAVQCSAWDPKAQALVQSDDAKPQALNAQGNLDSKTLAQVASPATLALQSCAPRSQDELNAWSKAVQSKAGLARICGQMRFQGSALAVPGSLITLAGVGARFNGDVFVSAVQHDLSDGNWISSAEFGLAPTWHASRPDVMDMPNAGLLPGVSGLQTGVVLKLDGDPEGENKIQVKLPTMQATTEGVWARLLQFHASSGFGSFFLPEVGDEVVLAHFNNDPSHPVVLGSLYSSKHAPPYALAAENNTKALVTRCKHKFEFNEEDKIITLSTPGGNQMVLDDKDKSILLKDQNGNSVKLSSAGIALDSPKDITLKATGNIQLTATQGVSIKADMDVKLAGMNISAEAQVGASLKGTATAELSASGQTTVKGAMVMIN